jgi:hypothetical protein
MEKEHELRKIVIPNEFVAGASSPNYLHHEGISPLLSNTRGSICLSQTLSPRFMLRRKLGPRMYDLKEPRAKPVPTWCTSCSHMARARPSRTRITTSQSNLLPLRRRLWRMRVALCVVPPIIGQRSAYTTKEENISLSKKM